jgi:hypothetical protein
MARSLADIARDIRADWERPYFGAVPYLREMRHLDSVTDSCGADSGRSVVAYFLANAGTWRGPVARSVKAELRSMLGGRS